MPHHVDPSSSSRTAPRSSAEDSRRSDSSIACIIAGLICLTIPACCVMFHDGRRIGLDSVPGWRQPALAFRAAKLPAVSAELPVPPGAEYVLDDDACLRCHQGYETRYLHAAHQSLSAGQSCETCHGPGSKHVETKGRSPGLIFDYPSMTPIQRSEACAACHETNACGPNSDWRTSVHMHADVACTDCHTIHSLPPPDSAAARALRRQGRHTVVEADDCFRCHTEMADLKRIAGPHQIGSAGFQCIDCHDPLGMIRETSRQELCLACHQSGTPTMAWHSSLHSIAGVACTDCHEPHPRKHRHAPSELLEHGAGQLTRAAMSVRQPDACYRCHPKMFAMSGLPSRHPIQEGKMACSDCHDAHGQAERGLREPILNDVCYRCHGDKQGPFTYDHPPVTEDCSICHQVHGSINDHLLHQPTSFLCLRCHAGHRSEHRPLDGRVLVKTQQALYGNCTQCHAQVHGSDFINSTLRGRGLTR